MPPSFAAALGVHASIIVLLVLGSGVWSRRGRQVLDIDVDQILEVDYPDADTPSEMDRVQVTFKDGTIKVYQGPDLPEVWAILNHWTPPTA
jgi:hypothetical protein